MNAQRGYAEKRPRQSQLRKRLLQGSERVSGHKELAPCTGSATLCEPAVLAMSPPRALGQSVNFIGATAPVRWNRLLGVIGFPYSTSSNAPVRTSPLRA